MAGQVVDLLAGEVERFRKMLLDLLENSRSDEDVDDRAMESIDLAILVAKVRETSHMTFPLVVEKPPAIYADRRRLVRVVANLVDNAERHGGGVSKVTVTERQGRARLEVDDAGPGVPVELRDQIFERFARGRHAGERGGESGSGLGLALVARMFGCIPVRSGWRTRPAAALASSSNCPRPPTMHDTRNSVRAWPNHGVLRRGEDAGAGQR